MNNEVPQFVLLVLTGIGGATVVVFVVKFLVELELRFRHPRCVDCQREYESRLKNRGKRDS